MSQQAPSPLQGGIIRVLQEAGKALRAIDIARALTEGGASVNASDVNKVLYRGPFEKITGAGTPVWKVREDAWTGPSPVLTLARQAEGLILINVAGVGLFALDPTLSDEDLGALLACLAALISAPSQKRLFHDASAGGKRMALLAAAAGFTPAETP